MLACAATAPSFFQRNNEVYTYILCDSGAFTRFYATVESSVMLCITIQKSIM